MTKPQFRFILPSIGTRGDVQPYIALAAALEESGHEAVVASHPCMRRVVESYHVKFAPIGPDIDIGQEAAAIRANAPHWMVGLLRVMKFSFTMLEEAHPEILALCQGADAVIVSHSAAGSIEADQLNLPKISVTLFPQAIPVKDENEPFLKRLVGSLAGWGMGLVMSRPLDKIRKKFGLPKMGPEGITSKTLNLLPISPHVIPPDPRWENRHKMTGYWFAQAHETWTPPEDLQAFLAAGDPPIVISLGAMALGEGDSEETASLTVEALRKVGVRAIIQGWDRALETRALPGTIFPAGSIPHTWLLPQARCFVHHGGFGSTAAAFQAGIPALVIPHIIDQFIWGQRVHELGVGPEPIPRKKLTAERLAEALEQAVHHTPYHQKAAALGALIRAEEGLTTAVTRIEETLAKSG
jgi:sterol 3beta-glucosyltransferase